MRTGPTVSAPDHEGPRLQGESAPSRAFVVIASPVASAIGKVLGLSAAPVSLSRLADDTVEDDWMSREHASARLIAGVAVVRDGSATASGWKASANGTFALTTDLRDERRVSEVEVPVHGILRTGRSLWMHVADPVLADLQPAVTRAGASSSRDPSARSRAPLPPLGDRPEDVLFIAKALLARRTFSGVLSWEAAIHVLRRPWRGDVHALDAFIERLVALARAAGTLEIDLAMCETATRALKSTSPVQPLAAPTLTTPHAQTQAPKRVELVQALVDNDWNKTEVGRIYGQPSRQITRWMTDLQIRRPTD